jgi:hypothetical protein
MQTPNQTRGTVLLQTTTSLPSRSNPIVTMRHDGCETMKWLKKFRKKKRKTKLEKQLAKLNQKNLEKRYAILSIYDLELQNSVNQEAFALDEKREKQRRSIYW